MIIICSWCGKKVGEKEPLEDKRVTNTKCDSCLNIQLFNKAYLGKPLRIRFAGEAK